MKMPQLTKRELFTLEIYKIFLTHNKSIFPNSDSFERYAERDAVRFADELLRYLKMKNPKHPDDIEAAKSHRQRLMK